MHRGALLLISDDDADAHIAASLGVEERQVLTDFGWQQGCGIRTMLNFQGGWVFLERGVFGLGDVESGCCVFVCACCMQQCLELLNQSKTSINQQHYQLKTHRGAVDPRLQRVWEAEDACPPQVPVCCWCSWWTDIQAAPSCNATGRMTGWIHRWGWRGAGVGHR